MQAQEFSWDQSNGWVGLDKAPKAPDLVLFFGHREILSAGETYDALRKRFPRAVIAGASGGGQICSGGIIDEGITGLALKFRTSRVKIATSVLSDKGSSFTVGENLARNLVTDDLKGVLVLADGIEINGDLMSAGLAKWLPSHIVVGGGMAADDDRFKSTLVSGNGWPQPFLAVAIGFYGEDLQVSSGIGTGWKSTGKEFTITASRHNQLYDINSRHALDIYEQELGGEAVNLPMSGLRFPLRIKDPAHPEVRLVRTLLGIDREVGMLTFAGNMPEGWTAELMHATPDALVQAASDAAVNEPAQASILVSCIGRRLVMGKRSAEEVQTYIRHLPAAPAITGFYSYGEFAMSKQGKGCNLYNQTLTAFSLRENEAAAQ